MIDLKRKELRRVALRRFKLSFKAFLVYRYISYPLTNIRRRETVFRASEVGGGSYSTGLFGDNGTGGVFYGKISLNET